MLTRRVIPCLDVRDGRVVKGVQFQNLRDAGDPVECAIRYESDGADELIFLDIISTPANRPTAVDTIRRIRRELSIPLTVGGGVRTIEDAARLLDAGADKVAINTAAVLNPELINQAANRFGAQCIVIAIDAAQSLTSWQVKIRSGSQAAPLDAVEWAKQAAALGAGEILLTSWDRDGSASGYDLALIRAVSQAVSIPVIASGGASKPSDLLEALNAGADAVLAASIFHDGKFTVAEVKSFLRAQGAEIRS